MTDLYLSDLSPEQREDFEKMLKAERPDLAQAIDDGDAIIIGSTFSDMKDVDIA